MYSFLVVVLCSLMVRSLAITPTSSPTVGQYDVQKNSIGWESSAAIDDTNKVVYIVKSGMNVVSGSGAIFKCSYTSISPYDCTTYVSPATIFYTHSSFTTESTSQYNNFYSTMYVPSMVYYNNALYFYVTILKSIFKCTALEKCYILADLNTIGSIQVGYILFDNSDNILVADYGNNNVYKIKNAADISAITVGNAAGSPYFSSICSSGRPSGMAFDSTYTNLYVACSLNGNTVLKCNYNAGSCSTYISNAATVAFDNTNAAIFLNIGSPIEGGLVVDVKNDNILYVSSSGRLLKCTATETCSPILQQNSLGQADDDGNSLKNIFGLKQDTNGYLYLTTEIGIYRFNVRGYDDNPSSSWFRLNSKMYAIIVLALFPFVAFFMCGFYLARRRYLGYSTAQTKESGVELTDIAPHTVV